VAASLSIVATDAANKSSAAVTLPIHVQSKVNNAPLITFGGAMPGAADPNQGGTTYPTYSCSVAANSCGNRGFVDLSSAITALPGPSAAFDDIATQTTAVVPYTGAGANGGNVQCAAESGSIFPTNGNPLVQASAGSNYGMNFFLNSPATVGSSLCTVTIADAMAAFPAGELAQTTAKQFRIVVNP